MENNNEMMQSPITIAEGLTEEQKQKRIEEILSGKIYVSADETKEVKNPEEKTYIVLYYATDGNNEDIKSFEVIKGRKKAYEFIKGMIDNIDIYESKVLTDNVPYKDAVSVYEFMKFACDILEEDSFDIEDYNYATPEQ